MRHTTNLRCCVCGGNAVGRQWYNRDTGYGICIPCANEWEKTEGRDSLVNSCGKRGYHYDCGPYNCQQCGKELLQHQVARACCLGDGFEPVRWCKECKPFIDSEETINFLDAIINPPRE